MSTKSIIRDGFVAGAKVVLGEDSQIGRKLFNSSPSNCIMEKCFKIWLQSQCYHCY